MTKVLTEQTTCHYSRIYILSLIWQNGKGCDSNLQKYLLEQNEAIVFNDKNKGALNACICFEPFYKALTSEHEKFYYQEMHSNVQFCVNRSGLLIPNIKHMVHNFGFKL